VLDAAIDLYAETGWAGFSFEAVARRASVGKASLYARWPTRGALLAQMFETRWLTVGRIDTGSLRGDLMALAHMLFETATSARGGVARWIAMDADLYADVRAVAAPYKEATVRQGRAIVRRAIARGEVDPAVNPGLLMDLLVGAVTNHTGTTPQRLRAAMIAKKDDFIDALVNAVLLGVGVRQDARGY
jgi:AcrR family transcriptional regulator